MLTNTSMEQYTLIDVHLNDVGSTVCLVDVMPYTTQLSYNIIVTEFWKITLMGVPEIIRIFELTTVC